MKDFAKQVFDAAVAIAPGLKNFVPEVVAQIEKSAAHGSNEVASAIHTSNAFVQYGVGQQPARPDYGQDHAADQAMEPMHEHQHEMEHEMGREM